MPDNKPKKATPKQKQDQTPPKESNLIWFAIALIALTGIIIYVANTLAPGNKGLTDDMLVRKTVRDQYDALFALDKERFLNCYSRDYDNGDYTYEDKVAQVEEISGTTFEIKDFYLEFIKSGAGEDKIEVHIDPARGLASTYLYTYWKQRTGESITPKPIQQLGAFLLRKEGTEWRIISEKNMPLQKREDAEHLMIIAEFKPFMDPSTIVWPPPKNENPPAQQEAAPVPEQEQPAGGNSSTGKSEPD